MRATKVFFFLVVMVILFACEREGPEGKKSLIDLTAEPAGANCINGGIKVISGIDLNNNGSIEENEIHDIEYVCNGNNGVNSLLEITPEPEGEHCISGGYKVNSGIDINNNDTLDNSEIQNTDYICDGYDAINSIVKILTEPEGDNCSAGGFIIISGDDLNLNNILDEDEILNTQYVCIGSYDELVRLDFSNTNYYVSNTPTGYIGRYYLPNFDLNNYSEIDSIVFGVYLRTTNTSVRANCELYNLSNRTTIQGTKVSSYSEEFEVVTTNFNFIDSIPDGKNDYSVKVTIESSSYDAFAHSPFIALYKK